MSWKSVRDGLTALQQVLSQFGRISLQAPEARDPAIYAPYTTLFDREISGRELSEFFDRAKDQGGSEYQNAVDAALNKWRAEAHVAALEAPLTGLPARAEVPTVVSLLIDHSGSMRGQGALLAVCIAEVLSDLWNQRDVAYEVLGFTTSSWKGGLSREKWLTEGKPPYPGRLCDLLHIVYRAAEERTSGLTKDIRNMLREEVLKENIDGEAILWAAERLRKRPETRKVLFHLSDGAPVDDSTLSVNPETFLVDHINKVIKEIKDEHKINLVSIGLNHSAEYYFGEQSILVTSIADIRSVLLPFVAKHTFSSPFEQDGARAVAGELG